MSRLNHLLFGAVLGLSLSVAIASAAWALADEASDEDIEFNRAFLRSDADLKQFSKKNPVSAGPHVVDLYVNEQWRGRTRVIFRNRAPGDAIARPCYDRDLFDTLGLRADAVVDADTAWADGALRCDDLVDLVPGTQAVYDSGLQRLDIAAPQIALDRVRRGSYVDPAYWETGISAATLGYDYNAYQSERLNQDLRETSQFLGLNFGVNLGAWRLRHLASVTDTDHDGLAYDSGIAFARRVIPAWRSQMTLGDDFTEGRIMESIAVRGVTLESDERMLPDTLRGFAPTIQGVAESNARVTVLQSGRAIYETNVPPGAFVIDDLYPAGSQEDLQVVITEADGSQRTFRVPYAAAPQLLRPGATRYSLTAGFYRNDSVDDTPALARGTFRHGLSNSLSVYTGGLVSERYAAATGGVALNTGLGALAVDITGARTDREMTDTATGYSLRLTYANTLPVVGTNVTLSSYRYSSRGYYSANDAFGQRRQPLDFKLGEDFAPISTRNQFVLNATQNLPRALGALYVTGNLRDYWARSGTDIEYSAGYNMPIGRANIGLSATRARALGLDGWETTGNLTLSLGFDGPAGLRQASTNYSQTSDQYRVQESVSGVVGEDRSLVYNAFAGYADGQRRGESVTGGGNMAYRTGVADIGVNGSLGPGVRQYGASVSGGVVGYGGGLVFAPRLGDTIGIVEADDAGGAAIAGQPGIHLSPGGRAVVPYLTPYRRNEITIDPDGLSTDIALEDTDAHVAPTAGAVVLLSFATDTGHSMLLKTRRDNTDPLPFAAAIYDDDDQLVGHIGQGSQAILRVAKPAGRLRIAWGANDGDECQLSYALPEDTEPDRLGYYEIDSVCHASL